MSDDDHEEPEMPTSEYLATRLFTITAAGIVAFIVVTYAFVIL